MSRLVLTTAALRELVALRVGERMAVSCAEERVDYDDPTRIERTELVMVCERVSEGVIQFLPPERAT